MYTIGIIIVLYFYVRLGIWVTRKAVGRCDRKRTKWGVRIAVALIFILIPTGDEIAGRIYFNYLCETEAGTKVYQTIELPAKYWDEDGKPKFYANWDADLGRKYPLVYTQGASSSLFCIDNAGFKFVDKQTGETLGEVVNFRYWGGWLRNNFSLHNTAKSCELDENIINRIFLSENRLRRASNGNSQ